MRYISTRGTAPELNFEEAMLSGLARDGGLYLPKCVPILSKETILEFKGRSYEEIAYTVMEPFVRDAFSREEFLEIINKSYSNFRHLARAPIQRLSEKHFLLELFHGPTLAFKDFAMQLIGQLFRVSLAKSGRRVTIIGATSGDTGSAAIEAFKGLKEVDVFIFFPRGRVSEVQRRQMSTPSENNVHAISIDGDFDDCQKIVKDLFSDLVFRDKVNLSGVNSINWARIMAQIVYYFSSFSALDSNCYHVSYTVPTGNFGDIFAGYMAKQMGLPISKLYIATNQNDILHNTLISGHYTRAEVKPSISPSMDIQVSSNFERAVYYALNKDTTKVCKFFESFNNSGSCELQKLAYTNLLKYYSSGRVSEAQTAKTIMEVRKNFKLDVCPHTAIGLKVAEDNISEETMITLATAHPGKFSTAFQNATGKQPESLNYITDLFDKEERITELKIDLEIIKKTILERI